MSLDKRVSDTIAALVAARSRGQAGGDWERDIAVRFGALSVYCDIGGALMVRPDGSVLTMGWDDEQPTVVSEEWRIIGLAAASYHFPDLAELAPARPATAQPCWRCNGPGCESCFGLGWVATSQCPSGPAKTP
jgi:hypothetical protein